MNLTYDTTLNTETGDLVSYNFTCDDCGAKGKEFYTLEFTEMGVIEND